MKQVFYVFCVLAVIAGLGFYHGTGHVSKNAQISSPREVKTAIRTAATEVSLTETTHAQTAETRTQKKRCACCRTTLENIKQKRKELEMWAREMIDTHGNEDGMRRVTAKSPTLAKRVQGILEQEKNSRRNLIQPVR